jgi:hypothetical protein
VLQWHFAVVVAGWTAGTNIVRGNNLPDWAAGLRLRLRASEEGWMEVDVVVHAVVVGGNGWPCG